MIALAGTPLGAQSRLIRSTHIIRGGRAQVLPRGESEGSARAFPLRPSSTFPKIRKNCIGRLPLRNTVKINRKHWHYSRRASPGSPPWGVRGVCAGPFPLRPSSTFPKIRKNCTGQLPLGAQPRLIRSTHIIRGGRAQVLPRGESEGSARANSPPHSSFLIPHS
jgi:hypothetical protein